MVDHIRVGLPLETIRAYCRKQPIQRLALFGSVLRDDFTDESDVDMLVEFQPGAKVGYFKLVEIQDDLSALVGRPVDLLTPKSLSPYFRQRVLDTAQVIYEAERDK